jgi:hypothetical protein
LSIKYGICYFKECDVNYLKKSKNDICKYVKERFGIELNPDTIVIGDSTLNLEHIKEKYFTGMVIDTTILTLLVVLNIIQCYLKFGMKINKKNYLIYDIDIEKKFIENDQEKPKSNSLIKTFFANFNFI